MYIKKLQQVGRSAAKSATDAVPEIQSDLPTEQEDKLIDEISEDLVVDEVMDQNVAEGLIYPPQEIAAVHTLNAKASTLGRR